MRDDQKQQPLDTEKRDLQANLFPIISPFKQSFFRCEFVSYQLEKPCVAVSTFTSPNLRTVLKKPPPSASPTPFLWTTDHAPRLLCWGTKWLQRLENAPPIRRIPPPNDKTSQHIFVAAPGAVGKLEVLWRNCRLPVRPFGFPGCLLADDPLPERDQFGFSRVALERNRT